MITLPPAGWAVFTDNDKLLSFSALDGTNRVDYLRGPEYTYLDGRGHWYDALEAASDGGLVIRPAGKKRLDVLHISGEREFVIRRPYGVRGQCVACEAADVDGKPVPEPYWRDDGEETRVAPAAKAVSYTLTFKRRK